MLLRTKESFYANGRIYKRGEIVREGDPVLTGRAIYFEPVPDVEQATAAPGEKRHTRVPQRQGRR